MVFESYVVELLNKFAGQYLENLDPSQLRIGIWGGGSLRFKSVLYARYFRFGFLFKLSQPHCLNNGMFTFAGDVQLENLILKESALVRFNFV